MLSRIDKILENSIYKMCLKRIESHEEGRELCGHDLGHFIDVARIATILSLEEGITLSRDHIYAAALLHDIGRHIQYEDGTPHELASAELSVAILEAAGYSDDEIESIGIAISNHRNEDIKDDKTLSGYLYRADKLSRNCYSCTASALCDWSDDKKNTTLKI